MHDIVVVKSPETQYWEIFRREEQFLPVNDAKWFNASQPSLGGS
jgi:hypothetical protein